MTVEIRITTLNTIPKTERSSRKGPKTVTNFHLGDEEDVQDLSPVQQNMFILSVDPLFANLHNPSKQQEAIQEGLRILDELDHLRLALLGQHAVPTAFSSLLRLKQSLQNLSRESLSHELNEILLEIETRAVVELAKAGHLC